MDNIQEMLKGPRPTWDKYFSMMALVVASRSTCVRRKVGCVLVSEENRVIGTGYNGVARGLDHCIDHPCPGANASSGQDLDGCEAIHAEVNALINCSDPFEIRYVFVTASPCISCTKLLMNTPCRKLFYIEKYTNDGEDLWIRSLSTDGIFANRIPWKEIDLG